MSAGIGQATAASPTYSLNYIFGGVDHSPTSAKEGTTITSVPFNPSGSVQVQLTSLNGGGVNNKDISVAIASGPSLTLNGTKTVTTDAVGIASFSDLSIDVPGHYKLKAFNTKLGALAVSGLFTVWQNACTFNQPGGCPASGSNGLSVGYNASTDASAGELTVNTGVDQLSTNDGFCHAPAVTTAEATSDFNGTSRTIVLTFPKSSCGGAGQFQVLLGKDHAFIVLGGTTSTFNATDGLYEGDAPPCNATYQINGAQYKITPGVDPCLQSSVSRRSPTAAQIETLIVPGTDIRCI